MPDRLALRETTAETLREASVTESGQTLLRVIGPGWSANGRYYPEDVLRRDGPGVFTEGLHTYIDHPRRSDEFERPERSLRDLAGSLTETVQWRDGPAGPGLYARADVAEGYRPLLDELGGVIGVSIRGEGEGEHGEAEGRTGTIITALHSAESVDYVTRPAAGGRVVQLIEAVREARVVPLAEARNAGQWLESHIHLDFTSTADRLAMDGHLTRTERVALSSAIGEALEAFNAAVARDVPQLYDRDPFADPEPTTRPVIETRGGNPTMPELSEAEVQQLREAAEYARTLETRVSTLESERDEATTRAERAEEALIERDARDHAAAVLAGMQDVTLRESAQTRVIAQAVRDLPVGDDGSLDRDRLTENVERRARDEHAYVLEAAGVGQPRGVGGGPTVTTEPDVSDQALFEAFGIPTSSKEA